MNGDDVTAIVPCHEIVPGAALLAETLDHVSRIVLVDDGSSTTVGSQLEQLGTQPRIELVRLPRNVGKGSALRAGIAAALAHPQPPLAVITIDADEQHPPAAIPAFLAAGNTAELVVGDRLGDPRLMPLPRRVANRLSRMLLAVSLGRPVGDTQCGMRLLRGRALHEVKIPEGRYEAESKHLRSCLQRELAVTWVPIPAIYGSERSHFRAVRDGIPILVALAATTAK